VLNEAAAIPAQESGFAASPEVENFATDSDGTVAWALCTIDILLNEHTEPIIGDIFGKIYDTTYGVKIMPYQGNMMDVAESTFLVDLPYPEYDSEWDEEEEEALAGSYFPIDTASFMSDGSSTDAYMAYSISYNATANYDEPDLLMIRLETDAPAEQLATDAELVQWAQFRLANDPNAPYQKVACSSVVGGAAQNVGVYTRVGATEFDDTTIAAAGVTSEEIQYDEMITAASGEAVYEKTGNEWDYGNWESDITGNWHISCIAVLKIDKMDLDYSIFGAYEVKLGARVYATYDVTQPVSLGEWDTEYTLDEPEYNESGTTDETELNYMEIDSKTWNIDVKEDLGSDGRGEQRIYIELIASPYIYDDDIVRVYMDLELPEWALKDGTIVYQYLQLLEKDTTEGTDPYVSVGCQSTVGEEGEKIDNYLGVSKLDAESTAGLSVDEQNLDEKDIQRIFFPWSDEWAYSGTYETGTGTKVSTCVVEMPIAKDETRDEAIFAEYIVTKGAKLYQSSSDSEPSQISEEKTKINLGDVNYDADDFIDPAILDLFEDDATAQYDEDYIEKEFDLQGSSEATVDAATVFGDEDAVAGQKFYSVYESNNFLDQNDEIAFMFEADLPVTEMTDGKWIVQLVTLENQNTQEKISIGCLVQIGNPYVKAVEW
jgi:hypothetical protein